MHHTNFISIFLKSQKPLLASARSKSLVKNGYMSIGINKDEVMIPIKYMFSFDFSNACQDLKGYWNQFLN